MHIYDECTGCIYIDIHLHIHIFLRVSKDVMSVVRPILVNQLPFEVGLTHDNDSKQDPNCCGYQLKPLHIKYVHILTETQTHQEAVSI